MAGYGAALDPWTESAIKLTLDRGFGRQRLLRRVEAIHRSSAARLRANGREGAARRAARFAAFARLGIEAPEAMKRIYAAAVGLREGLPLSSLLDAALAGALPLAEADKGNVQLIDPSTGALRIAAHSGFDEEFLVYFAVVDDVRSACGRALRRLAQTVIEDVSLDDGFTSHRDIAAASGFRAVVSTPICDFSGTAIGVLSTHYAQPRRPTTRELGMMEHYADLVGAAVMRGAADQRIGWWTSSPRLETASPTPR